MVGEDSGLFLKCSVGTIWVPCAKDLVIVLGYGSGGEDSEKETGG